MTNRIKLFILAGIWAILPSVHAQQLQDLRTLQQTAQQLEALGRLDQAGELYARVARAQAAQRDLNAYSSAKYCFERIKAFDSWEALIRDLQKSYRNLIFEVDFAQIHFLRGETDTALRMWRQIIDSNPLDDQAYALVGALLLNHGRYDQAREIYERGRSAFKDPQKFFFEMVRAYQGAGAFSRMTEEYILFLQKNPAQIAFVQTQLLAAGDEPEAAQQIETGLQRAKSVESIRPLVYQLLAALYTQAREYGKALQCYDTLEEITAAKKPAEAGKYYYTFATVALSDGAFAEARTALKALLARTSEQSSYRIQASFTLAQVYEREGAYDQAVAAYESYIRRFPDRPETPALYLRLAALYFDRFFRVASADSVYEKLLKWPQVPIVSRLLAWQKRAECAIARGDLPAAELFLQKLKRESPGSSVQQRQAELMLAQIDLYAGRPGRARQKLETLVARPNGVNAKADTVQNDILDLYLLLRETRQDSLGLSLLGRALWLERRRHDVAALDTLTLLMNKSQNRSLIDRASLMQATLLRRIDRLDEALTICAALAADSSGANPDLALLMMAEIHQERAEPQKALQMLETFLVKYPESIYIEQVRGMIRLLEKQRPLRQR
jgi:tetratricopeptide (TPR) repeat protein